jgi:hypothetical protein
VQCGKHGVHFADSSRITGNSEVMRILHASVSSSRKVPQKSTSRKCGTCSPVGSRQAAENSAWSSEGQKEVDQPESLLAWQQVGLQTRPKAAIPKPWPYSRQRGRSAAALCRPKCADQGYVSHAASKSHVCVAVEPGVFRPPKIRHLRWPMREGNWASRTMPAARFPC